MDTSPLSKIALGGEPYANFIFCGSCLENKDWEDISDSNDTSGLQLN